MKQVSLLFCGAFFLLMCATSHAQRRTNLGGKTIVGSVLTLNTYGKTITKLEWKLNGQTVTTLEGSPRQGVTVAGGNGVGSGANQFNDPNSLFVDKDHNLWVADTRNARIQKFTPGSTNGETIGANLPNAPGFPTGVFVCSRTGAVYVADYFGSRVVRLAKNGSRWVTVASGGMDLTRAVWVDKNDNVYCTDYSGSRVLKFAPHSSSGVVVAGGNGYGKALSQLARPTSVMLDNEGNIYVADPVNDRVVKWAPGASQGVIVAGGNGRGDANNQSPYAQHVYVDKNKNVYVSNTSPYNKVQKWAPGSNTGKTVAGGNGEGDGADQFKVPFGIFVDGKYLYVTDEYNNRVQRFDLSSPNISPEFTATKPGTYTAAAIFEDGSQAVSNSITVSAAMAKETVTAKSFVYPNPAKNIVTLSFSAPKSSRYIFEIASLDGKVLLHKETTAIQGTNRTTLDVSRFAKGAYFINITRPDKTKENLQLIRE